MAVTFLSHRFTLDVNRTDTCILAVTILRPRAAQLELVCLGTFRRWVWAISVILGLRVKATQVNLEIFRGRISISHSGLGTPASPADGGSNATLTCFLPFPCHACHSCLDPATECIEWKCRAHSDYIPLPQHLRPRLDLNIFDDSFSGSPVYI